MSEEKIHVVSAGAPNGWGDHFWDTPESVVALPEKEALQLIRIPHSGFSQAEEYDARPAKRGRPPKKAEEGAEAVIVEPTVEPQGLASALDLVTPKG